MLVANMLFYAFSVLLIFSAFMVIVAQHPVFSLLFLVLSFLSSSFLLFLLECEFLALIFLIIYVGAIAILFLFAIMMLESKLSSLSRNALKYFPVGFLFGLLLLLPFLNEISASFGERACSSPFYFNKYQNWYDLIDSVNDIEVYGQLLYSYFVLQFLLAGLILLLVLISVVYLTNDFNTAQKAEQSVFKQLSRNSKFFFRS